MHINYSEMIRGGISYLYCMAGYNYYMYYRSATAETHNGGSNRAYALLQFVLLEVPVKGAGR